MGSSPFMDEFTARLLARCRECSADESRRSPFAVGAAAAGFQFHGGKQDDITIVAAMLS